MPNINVPTAPQTTPFCADGNACHPDVQATPVIELLKSVSNSAVKYLVCPVLNTGRQVYRSLRERSPWRVYRVCEQDIELQPVHAMGEKLRSEAEAINHSRRMQDGHQTLPLLLKGKVGVALGAALLTGTGFGAGYYFRRAGSNAQKEDFSEGRRTTTAGNSSDSPYFTRGETLKESLATHLWRYNTTSSGNAYPGQSGSTVVPEAENIPAGGVAGAGKRGRRHIDISDTTKEANSKIIWHLYNENYLQDGDINIQKMLAVASGYLLNVDSDSSGEQEDRMCLLARKILAAADLYGGRENEPISDAQAKSAVRHWFFSNVLGGSPGYVIARKIALSKSPSTYTPGKINGYFSFEKLYSYTGKLASDVSRGYFNAFAIMWNKMLNEEMPFLKFATVLDESFVLYGEQFASLYAGAKFMQENGQWNYAPEDAIKVGEVIWGVAINGNISVDQLGYFELPSIFFMAKHSPQKITNVLNVHDLSYSAILEYIANRKNNVIKAHYNHYRTAVNTWRSKGALADDILSGCPTEELVALPDIADGIRNQQERRENALPGARQFYLLGWRKPCKSAPDSLIDEFTKQTLNVADKYFELDRVLIQSAFNALPEDEYNFFSAAGVIMRPVYFSMSKQGAVWFAYNVVIDTDVSIVLNKTDLFSLANETEERIYALKRVNVEKNFYTIIRVDRDIRKYIHSGILGSDLLGTDYEVEGNTVISKGIHFGYTITTDHHKISARAGDIESLVHFLSTSHREKLYHALFEAGNDSSEIGKIWDVVKHIIPFYDCIEGVVNNDPVQAVSSCIMDALPVGTVTGMATDLSVHFAMKLAYGARSGVLNAGKNGLSLVVKNTLKHVSLPNSADMLTLGITAMRSIDPGFELLSTVSRSFNKKIEVLLETDSKTRYLSRKVAPVSTVDSQPLPLPTESIVASIPGTDLRLPLKRIPDVNGKNLYAQFNPETGEAFGAYYHRDDEQFHQVTIEYPGGSFSSENNLEYLLINSPMLNSKMLMHLTLDNKGLYRYIDSVTRYKKHALKVNEKFYQIMPGKQPWSMKVVGENNIYIEIARFDKLYYKINHAEKLKVKYISCRSLRSPGGRCVHLSPKLEAIFKENKRYGIPEGDVSSIKPAESHPGLYENSEGRLYIKYENVLFSLKNEGAKDQDEILSVTGPSLGGVFGGLIKKRIAEVTASRDGGGYYFNTPEENMMECAGTSQSVAELHSAMRRLSFMDHRNFLMPAEIRATGMRMDKKVLNDRDYYSNDLTAEEETIVSVFRKQTDEMLDEAKRFFKKGVSYLNKCHIPTISLTDKPKIFLSKIYEKNNGIAIGEFHSSIASKKFIIENIDVLHKNGVRTLYIEHLQTDMHQADLDSYFQTGKMSVSLKGFINEMDTMAETDLLGFYTFMTLIQTAQKRKIRITAIDSFVSYFGIPSGTGTSDRVALMNYYSHLLINKNQLHHQNKWIALVGSAHTNTFENVPGLADLNGAVSIRVNDLRVGEVGGIFKDPGEVYHCFRAHRARVVQADLLLEMGVTNMRRVRTTPPATRHLKTPGQFIIVRRGNQNFLAYMDREANILHFPIDLTEDNYFYLNTNEPRWDIVSRERFERLDAMISFIEEKRGMKLVA
ncbi:membrane-targeted effector domain-containing toxin [Erwinia piriflorinigrans]|uniref:Uncharacterized protein n=1 Tax=Erwinia piriflorinigrans CFBP 5888 TaxID=1161919 RepID=V5ZBK2_9GAMM|nr:membrane-targeted effector domain-containing toxin [Erwinia piriflorinigrans]CCG88395.1 hypothetical protein EPIR_3032 [Erwinia piriflorinigrans CFBP 5888]